jgi:bla regulator protein blaR1
MNPLEYIVSAEFIRAFAWTLFHSLWQGGLIAMIAAGLMMILRKHRPGVRYAVLYMLMLLLPVLFAGTFLMIYNPANTSLHSTAQMAGPVWQSGNSLAGNLQAIPVTEIPHAWYAYLVHLFENEAQWLVLFWFTGFLIFLLRFSGSFIYVYRLKNRHIYEVEGEWQSNLRNLSGKIRLQRKVKLAESALARIPLTIGYLNPVILLPLGTLSGVPPQQLEAILLHELAHILRKDYLLNIIQSIIELLFFYHPVTWWLSGLIRQEREHICDDIAVSVNKDHINYIKALTTMEELNSKSPFLASAMTGTKKKLLFRVKRLLSPVKLRKGFNEGLVAFILLAGFIFAISLNALSIIPNAYDLTGRESGEKVYSLLNSEKSHIQVQPAAEIVPSNTVPAAKMVAEIPDTIRAKSKSGKVVISVYTDSTDQLQQEQLDRMAESMDRQAQESKEIRKEYQIQVKKYGDDKDHMEHERQIVIIQRPDTTLTGEDSVVVIYNDNGTPRPGHHFEYNFELPECPVPPDPHMFGFHYSYPGLPDLDSLDHMIFSLGCDSIDTLLYMGPEGHMFFDNKDLELSSKEWQQQMEQLGKDLEKQQRNIEKRYRDNHSEMQTPEASPFFYSVPPVPPDERQWNEHNREPRIAPSEKIIRQELFDDGLAAPDKKYVVDINSKGMYINGEKQSKDVFRKYKHLIESLDLANLEAEDTYRLIF